MEARQSPEEAMNLPSEILFPAAMGGGAIASLYWSRTLPARYSRRFDIMAVLLFAMCGVMLVLSAAPEPPPAPPWNR